MKVESVTDLPDGSADVVVEATKAELSRFQEVGFNFVILLGVLGLTEEEAYEILYQHKLGKVMNFTEWLQEREGVTSRAERLYEDFPEVKDLEKLRCWLKAAYLVGLDRSV